MALYPSGPGYVRALAEGARLQGRLVLRNTLSKLISAAVGNDPSLYVLSGDHGYALFDELRSLYPDKFLNVGISEQAMIGYASGMHKVGLRTIVYGLAAFVPLRVLEQIKLDLCLSSRPAIVLGDGAGVVYTTLGSSHQCAEDVAALRALPNITIFSPCDRFELETCFDEALASPVPVYIRVGKSDRPEVHQGKPAKAGINLVHTENSDIALVATGSMVSIAKDIGQKLRRPVFSVSRLKPFNDLGPLKDYRHLITLEEHSKFGGLFSALSELIAEDLSSHTKVSSFSLEGRFADKCGDYQYALSEHNMSDSQLFKRIQARIMELGNISL